MAKTKTAKEKKEAAARRRKEVIPPIDPKKGKKAHDLNLLEDIMHEELEAFPEKQRQPLIHYMTQYLQGNIKLDLDEYHTIPVDPRTFLMDDFYLGLKDDVYPALIDEFCEMNSGKYIEIVLTGGIGCVDYETEYLTPRGWKPIGDYDGGDVAQYHEDGRIEFVSNPEYVVYDCDGFYHFKTGKGIDQMLSPEHRVAFEDHKGDLKILPAEEVVRRHETNKAGFGGKFRTTFKVDREGLKISEEDLRVMCMCIADGSFFNTGARCRVAVKREDKIERVKTLLNAASIPFRVSVDGRGVTVYTFYAPFNSKSFSWAWEATEEQLRIIIEEYARWDGCHEEDRVMPRIFTSKKQVADFFSYAGSACGYRTAVNGSDRCVNHATEYKISFNACTTPGMKANVKPEIERVPAKDGKKYCFHVPTGLLVLRRNGRVFVTGNTGKTTLAVWNTAYQLYLLSCLKNPHRLFKLDKSSEILIVFQSITADLARKLNYNRFKALIDQSPYFQTRFPYDRRVETELKYPNRIYVRPVSGEDTAAIGQNVIGGIIDEINYMAVTSNSKKEEGGGTYDQAAKVYNSIARRRKSRFMTKGQIAGLLCLVSSRKYPGQFTDRKEEEAKKDKTIYIYDKTIWMIKPKGTYGTKRFNVFIGDVTRKPRIMEDHEDPRKVYPAKDQHLVRAIPVEFKGEFQTDMVNALREVAGVATLASHPFILNTDAIEPCFNPETKSVFKESICNFDDKKLHVLRKHVYAPDIPRFIHIDLSLTGDATGFVMGCIPRFTTIDRGDVKEVHPVFRIDGALSIEAPQGGEIIYWRIRKLIYALRDMGYNIKWITFDTHQSNDSKQILAQNGFITGVQSVDTTNIPYEIVKSAIYDKRLVAPPHDLLQLELARLEKNTKDDKIDHPPGFSKDVADSLAGVCYGLMMRREIWAQHGINPDNVVNADIEAMKKAEAKLTKQTERINKSSQGAGFETE